MRVLHVTDTFLPRLGGIELHVAALAAHQRTTGHQALVLTAEPLAGADGCHVTPGAVPVERLRCGTTGIGMGAAIETAIAKIDPDLIHAHLTVGSPFAWAVLRNTARLPVVATMHSLLPEVPALVRAGVRIARIPTERISFTAVSAVAASRLRAALRPDCRVEVLHNGIDPAEWAVQHRPSGTFEILVIGRLVARKRPLSMVAALAQLSDIAPELQWRATFVGDGPQRGKIEAAIHRHGLSDRVRMQGALAHADIKALLGIADVLVAPARLESFGIAALEARCAGVPIVGMAGSGITEFVEHGVDGLLASVDADIARCVRQISADAVLAAAIRHHNSTVAVRMTWDDVLARHDEVYAAELSRGTERVWGRPARTKGSALQDQARSA
jgi:phosphatidylinositol alpha 1,6-mannosyltransferase